MRPLRIARAAAPERSDTEGGAGDPGSELEALSSFYASRIAAVRAGARREDVGALVKAIQTERVLAVRALLTREHLARQNRFLNRPSTARMDDTGRIGSTGSYGTLSLS